MYFQISVYLIKRGFVGTLKYTLNYSISTRAKSENIDFELVYENSRKIKLKKKIEGGKSRCSLRLPRPIETKKWLTKNQYNCACNDIMIVPS
jgi:hypothetical protein